MAITELPLYTVLLDQVVAYAIDRSFRIKRWDEHTFALQPYMGGDPIEDKGYWTVGYTGFVTPEDAIAALPLIEEN